MRGLAWSIYSYINCRAYFLLVPIFFTPIYNFLK